MTDSIITALVDPDNDALCDTCGQAFPSADLADGGPGDAEPMLGDMNDSGEFVAWPLVRCAWCVRTTRIVTGGSA